MLLRLHLEPWRSRPAEAALVGARPPPWPAWLEMLGSFPAMLDSEHGAQVLHPIVQGAGPTRPASLVGVIRIAEKVVVAVRLFRQLSYVAMVTVDRAEAPGAVGIEVKLAISGCDQFRQRFPDAAGAAEPVQ